MSSKDLGQRAILKFAKFIKATSVNARFSPGTFTNHSQAGFREPRLVIVTDPVTDHQAIREASYVNIPTIGLCDADTNVKYIDCVIPCNNRAPHSIGLVYWLLAREVQRLRGLLSRKEEWEVMPDLFFYRNLEEIKKQEEAERKQAEDAALEAHGPVEATDYEQAYDAAQNWDGADNYGATNDLVADDWQANTAQGQASVAQDWTAEATATTGDWTAEQSGQWN